MNDSTFTFPVRQKAFFSHDFDFSGSHRADSSLTSTTPVVREKGAFIMTHPAGKNLPSAVRADFSSDWIFWVLMGGMLLLTITKFYYEKRLGLLVSAVFSKNAANTLIRESSILRIQSFVYLLVIYLISMTLLLLQLYNHFSPSSAGSWKDLLLYLEVVGAFIAYFIVKITVIRLGGFIFKNPDTASEYIQNMFIYNLFAGILLLPLLLLITYSGWDVFIYISLGMLAIVMVLRLVRGIIVGIGDHKFSLFHLFLYLCTLEILPVLVIAKFVDKYFFQ